MWQPHLWFQSLSLIHVPHKSNTALLCTIWIIELWKNLELALCCVIQTLNKICMYAYIRIDVWRTQYFIFLTNPISISFATYYLCIKKGLYCWTMFRNHLQWILWDAAVFSICQLCLMLCLILYCILSVDRTIDWIFDLSIWLLLQMWWGYKWIYIFLMYTVQCTKTTKSSMRGYIPIVFYSIWRHLRLDGGVRVWH